VNGPLKILIVDDEPEARELLKFMLEEDDSLQVIGLAGSVDEAISISRAGNPDLVFLDIQMPEKDGFQYIQRMDAYGKAPGIIFVTAFDNYAIQAIRKSVFDYILKPVHRAELMEAVGRFRSRDRHEHSEELKRLIDAMNPKEPAKIKLNTRSGYILINPSEVVYCQADGNYTHIMMSSGNDEITTQNLGAIEGILNHSTFFRVSRSYLVNLKYLSRVDRKSGSCLLEYGGHSISIHIPAQKIKLLESSFN
jgi:DNA-binding LytR/AlgR family response regulator